MEDAYIIDEVLGGHVTSGRSQGEAAARGLSTLEAEVRKREKELFGKGRKNAEEVRG